MARIAQDRERLTAEQRIEADEHLAPPMPRAARGAPDNTDSAPLEKRSDVVVAKRRGSSVIEVRVGTQPVAERRRHVQPRLQPQSDGQQLSTPLQMGTEKAA